jgi:hypothetical protein
MFNNFYKNTTIILLCQYFLKNIYYLRPTSVISSVVNISKLPSENNQANIPYINAPYAEYQEGIVVLMDDKWIFFEAR